MNRRSDGLPAVLAVTSPATGDCAEVTAHGTKLELRYRNGRTDAAGLAARVAAVLTARAAEKQLQILIGA